MSVYLQDLFGLDSYEAIKRTAEYRHYGDPVHDIERRAACLSRRRQLMTTMMMMMDQIRPLLASFCSILGVVVVELTGFGPGVAPQGPTWLPIIRAL